MSVRVKGQTVISNSELSQNLTPSLDSTGNPVNAVELTGMDSIAVQANYSNATPSAVVFASTAVNTSTETITAVAHGLSTGLKGQFTTTVTLPTGLSLLTDYFIIRLTADTFQVASSLALAVAGTPINLTGQGSGNDTFTPTSNAGNVLKLQGSIDGVSWSDISAATVTIGATTGSTVFNLNWPSYRYLGFNFASAAGAVNLTVIINGIAVERFN